jgi:hypothetical protein
LYHNGEYVSYHPHWLEEQLTYQARPQVTQLRLSVTGQTDMAIRIDNGISPKVKPTILEFVI